MNVIDSNKNILTL